jgi:hypothetical protein
MYNKLFAKILDSSIWLEDHPTRIVWITLLAAMDQDGFAPFSTVQNLARRAGVTDAEAESAVATLEGPDRWKQAENDPGNRIERVPGGFFVIKAAEYGAIVRREEMRAAVRERVRRHREAKSGCNAPVTQSDVDQTCSEVDVAQKAVRPSPLTRTKPLGYRGRTDVAWPGRPPVPGSLHEEFVSKLGGDPEDARRRLGEWYPKAAAEYANQPIGDDDFKFWRARFREWVGTTEKPSAPSARPAPRYADDDWCWHEPRCNSREYHAVREKDEVEV